MIIKEISLKNFQCFSGGHQENRFIFSTGVNLIIGNNGAGKSKLFDAFYWVIYDQIFLSDDREFIDTSRYKADIISDRAKACADVGKTVSAEVTLNVVDSQDREFIITRVYKALKLSDREWEGDRSSQILVNEIKAGVPQAVPTAKQQNILNMVIPGHLKPYMWFQGEQVDNLMDLTNRSSLKQTINLLSDISDYDRLIEVAEQGAVKANKDLSKARTNSSRNKAESERLASDEKRLRDELSKVEMDIHLYQGDVQLAREGIEELIGRKSDAEAKLQLKAQRSNFETESRAAESELDQRLKDLNSRLFKDHWLLRNVNPFTSRYLDQYKQYNSTHNQTIAALKFTEHRLPVDMPRPVHVQEMLEANECFLCGREAREGTPEYDQIKSHLNRDKPDLEGAFVNDCSEFFGKLYENAIELRHLVSKLDERIPTELQKIQELKSKIKKANLEIELVDKQFQDLLEDDGSENIVAEYKQHEMNRTKYEDLLKRAENRRRELNASLSSVLIQQAKLTEGSIDADIELGAEVWNSLKRLTCSTKEFVFSQLVEELQSSANKIFAEMTSRNRSITGRLRLKIVSEDKVRAEIVDGDGFPIPSSNLSNIILVKLALMMAILKSKALWSKNYTMVTDAPTSKMAAEYSQGFYEALSSNFSQSIVMTYDFLRDEDLDELDGVKLGKIYRLDPYYPGENRDDRSDLSVRIVEVKV